MCCSIWQQDVNKMGRGDQTLLTCPSLVPSAVNGESAWERWLVCGCAVPYITNFNALCCLRPFYQNQHECSAVWAAAAPHVHLWVLAAHDPVAASPLFFPWTLFIDPDDCKPGTPHHSCVFGDALSIHYRWALVKITQILMLSFEDKMFSMLIKKKWSHLKLKE